APPCLAKAGLANRRHHIIVTRMRVNGLTRSTPTNGGTEPFPFETPGKRVAQIVVKFERSTQGAPAPFGGRRSQTSISAAPTGATAGVALQAGAVAHQGEVAA